LVENTEIEARPRNIESISSGLFSLLGAGGETKERSEASDPGEERKRIDSQEDIKEQPQKEEVKDKSINSTNKEGDSQGHLIITDAKYSNRDIEGGHAILNRKDKTWHMLCSWL